jgi:hypothetical protein
MEMSFQCSLKNVVGTIERASKLCPVVSHARLG